jgi:hypothetical protein
MGAELQLAGPRAYRPEQASCLIPDIDSAAWQRRAGIAPERDGPIAPDVSPSEQPAAQGPPTDGTVPSVFSVDMDEIDGRATASLRRGLPETVWQCAMNGEQAR